MSELKQCPFCGGVANTLHRPHVVDWRYSCGCADDECRGFICLSWLYKTKEEAIAAWNRRDACFHCQYGAKPMTEENMRAEGWVRERTCRNVCDWRDEKGVLHSDARLFKCSECGYKADDFYGDDEENFPRYCPNCGARVLPEISDSTHQYASKSGDSVRQDASKSGE